MAGGVELATAYVTLIPSLGGAKGKIGKEVEPEGEAAGDDFSNGFLRTMASLGGKIVGALAAIGVGKAVSDLVRASFDEYANYEQLVGGMQTLYGDAAETVMANAEEAFHTAGLSANEYMETVTSFSASLINSVGGDTERAAALADQALQDMSDNANRMGTDMESIQNAYRGFARGNFTMLDNLSLGFAGTKEGMEQLLAEAERIQAANGNMVDYSIDSYADMVEAIHVVQDNMGIAGATAEEAASTISGSIASTQAAWTNLITHLADENADIPALLENVFSSATNVIRNVGQRIPIVLSQMFQAIPAALQGMGDLFAPLVPALLEMAPGLLQSFTTMLVQLANGIPQALPSIIAGAAQLFQGLLLALIQVMPQLTTGLMTALSSLVMMLVENAPNFLQGALDMFNTLWQAIITVGPEVLSNLISMIGELLANVLAAAPGMLVNAGQLLGQLVAAVINAAPDAITAIADLLQQVFDQISDFDLLQAGIDLMQGLIDGIASMAGQVWDAVCGAVQGAVDGALQFLGIASPSKVFRQIGEYTMEGFAEGIDDASAQARMAMLDATSGVVGAAEMTLSSTTQVGAPQAGGVYYYITFNDATVNDTPAIRREVDDFVLTMLREADQ